VTQKSIKPKGRPRVSKEKSRSEFISTRLSPEERDQIEEAIQRSGKSKTTWVRDVLLTAANG